MGYESIEMFKAKLVIIIKEYPNEIFIGNFMDGFATIMFGVLLKINNKSHKILDENLL